jgi:hypothetical protein
LFCLGVLWVAREVGVVEAGRLDNVCLRPRHFWMVDLVCEVGANCILHDWCWHRFDVDGGSHSLHDHPSTKMSCYIRMG